MGQTTPTNLRAHIWVGEAHFGHARARAHVPRAGLRHGLAQWLLELDTRSNSDTHPQVMKLEA